MTDSPSLPWRRACAMRLMAWYMSASASSAHEQAITTVCGMAEVAARYVVASCDAPSAASWKPTWEKTAMTGAWERADMVKGRLPLVTPNWPNVSTIGIKPALEKPAPVLIMFASATPTSIKRSGKLFWKKLMPVEPARSAEME